MIAQSSTGWQKIVLYILLLAYLVAPIYQIINCFEIEKIKDKKANIDKKLNPSQSVNNPYRNNDEEIYDNNYCEEEDCDKNKEKEFDELFENCDFYLIPYFIIIIIMFSLNLIIIIFRCISMEEGIKCAATCCMCCGKDLPACIEGITKCALFHPLITQCILEGIFFIVSCVHLKNAKKLKSKIPSSYMDIYNDMVHYEKCLTINIVVSIFLFSFTVAYHFLDKCCSNQIRGEITDAVPEGVVQNQ